MKKQTHRHDQDSGGSTGDAGAALATLGDVAGKKLEDVRKNLALGVEGAQQEASDFLRARPYHALAIALGVGALLGFFIAKRSGRD
jgi:ElaB/YqjD/DUF883 family membrane-anchored ribosome-binding protein